MSDSTPAGDQYKPITTQPPSDTASTDDVGPLPFSGYDAGIVLAVGVALTAGGLKMQRALKREKAQPWQDPHA